MKRKAGSPWVEQMISKHLKLPTHRLILVSAAGFTGPALAALEREKDFEAVTFEEAAAVDWGAYAERLSDLRFGGFELKPLNARAQWQEPLESAGTKRSLDPPTAFRRLADGRELPAFGLALDVLKNRDVGKVVMERN